MKRIPYLLIMIIALGMAACEWTPSQKVLRIENASITRGDIACPDRLSESSPECRQLRRLKMRRVLFDAMLDRAMVAADVSLSENAEQQIEQFIESLAPARERYATAARCHAIAALRGMGEPVEGDPDCTVDERQVEEMARVLSKRELEELIEESFIAEMEKTQRANLRAELTLRKIYDALQEAGRDDEQFWREMYEALDPVFYDANLRMGPAEVMTGDPNGWSRG